MSLGPWFKCYPADWLEGIRDLTLPAQGAYAHLVMRMYDSADAIRADDARIGKWLNSNARGWRKVKAELIQEGKLIELSDGSLINLRCLREMAENCKTNKRIPAFIRERIGKLLDMFGESFPKQLQNNCETSPEKPLETRPLLDTRSQKPDTTPNGVVARQTDFEKSKPKKRGPPRQTSLRADWQPSVKDLAFAASKELTPQEIEDEADRFRQHFLAKGTRWKDWHRVWQNWITSDIGPVARKSRGRIQPHTASTGRMAAALAQAAHELDAIAPQRSRYGQEHHQTSACSDRSGGRSQGELIDVDGRVVNG